MTHVPHQTIASETIEGFKQDAKLVVANWKPLQKELQGVMTPMLLV